MNECLQKIDVCGRVGKTQTISKLIFCIDKEGVLKQKLRKVKHSRS
jgi:hypothetical protein